MISLVTINIGTLFGILYFFINLFNIRNLQTTSSNYFSSLNNYGQNFTCIIKGVFYINISSLIFAFILLTIRTETQMFSKYYFFYIYSFLGMILSFISLVVIGYIYIKYSFLLNSRLIPDNDNIEFEFMFRNDTEFNYKCCICLEEKKFNTRAKLVPCNHSYFCKDCSIRVGNLSICPLCRHEIKKITIFINSGNSL